MNSWETHRCLINIVAPDALVLKHQAISIHNADLIFIVLDLWHAKILNLLQTTSEIKITFEKKMTQLFKGYCNVVSPVLVE